MCLWGNGKGNVLFYIGKRIERREKGEVGHSKDSGAKRKLRKIKEK